MNETQGPRERRRENSGGLLSVMHLQDFAKGCVGKGKIKAITKVWTWGGKGENGGGSGLGRKMRYSVCHTPDLR